MLPVADLLTSSVAVEETEAAPLLEEQGQLIQDPPL